MACQARGRGCGIPQAQRGLEVEACGRDVLEHLGVGEEAIQTPDSCPEHPNHLGAL